MISVLNMHTAFWTMHDRTSEWGLLISLLFDVPAYFVISGMLAKECGVIQGAGAALRQALRLYGTYWTVVLIGIALISLTGDGMRTSEWWSLALIRPSREIWSPFVGFPGSIWFLRVYMLLLPALVLSRSLSMRWLLVATASALVAWVVLIVHPVQQLERTLPFHAMFLMAGVITGRLMRTGNLSRRAIIAGGATCAGLAAAFYAYVGIPDPNHMKFPPTVGYLLWCTPPLALLLLLAKAERDGFKFPGQLWDRFLSWCGRNVFEFYLVQMFVASIPLLLTVRLGSLKDFSFIAAYGAVLIWNIGATSFFVYVLIAVRGQVLKFVAKCVDKTTKVINESLQA